jgi:Fur family ferric uptake transcriptional regulator
MTKTKNQTAQSSDALGPPGSGPEKPGQRNTRQRRAVLTALAQHPEFTSAQALHQRLRAQGQHIGLTTVYRTLYVLVEAGLADSVRDESGRQHFRARPTAEHQHYLRCRQCGFNIPVASPALERWARTTARELGFTQVEHVVELTGVCPRCESPTDGRPTPHE